MVYSAALLALWLWLDLCGSGGAWLGDDAGQKDVA